MNRITPPAISVILPFYNAESSLHDALLSVAGQTFTHFECLMVNNNATDRSPEIALRWQQKDARFRLVEELLLGRSLCL
ncbi:MAG: glycosyltransferase [Bacteroidales bacterium]|nr:glycosyltransferase [Bacteroidales bacterium]